MRPRASLLLLIRFITLWRANPKNLRNMLVCLASVQLLACASCVGDGWKALGQRDRLAVASVGHNVCVAGVRGSRAARAGSRRVVAVLVGLLRR